MDNLTHSLVGALLGQTGLKKKTGLAMPALIIGANLPDVDAACFFWLEGTEHLGFRRGITHGPPAWVLLPLVLAAILWWFDRWQEKRGKQPEGRLPVNFKWLYLLGFIGCLTHPALDWLNVYGVRFLEPFSSQWFYGDTLFIIDVWLWALLAVSVWWSLRKERRGADWTRSAWIGGMVGLAYIGMNAAISYSIKARSSSPHGGELEVIPSPPPFAFWRRDVIYFDQEKTMWMQVDHTLGKGGGQPRPIAERQCLTFSGTLEQSSQYHAFVFWSRAPFFEPQSNGGLVLRDARFYDPLARGRFSVTLPDVECEELPSPSP